MTFRLPPLAILLALFTAGAAHAAQPNILFLFSDDHATGAISAYGSEINHTPNLDRIASEGALFEHSFCANSLCGPSRACILTGKHSHANGFLRNGNRFDPLQTTFPPLLQKAGYATALIGKWHLGTDPVGFDHWEVLPGQGFYYNPAFLQQDGTRLRREGYCTDLITDLALEWLRERRDPDKPFLLMCQHKAPHRNWSPAARHLGMFNDGPVAEPPTLRDDYAGRSELLKENEMTIDAHMHWGHDMKFKGKNRFPEHFVSGMPNGEYRRMNDGQRAAWDAHYAPLNRAMIARLEAGEMTDDEILSWKYQRYIKDYLRCVQAVDDGVGRMLDYLDESGLADNTIVVYASDQGFYLGEHGWYDKRWMFEESLEMPLLVRWPGEIEAGSRPQELVQNIDYGPTLLDAAGVAVPDDMQGESFLPILRGESPDGWRDSIYYAYYENAAYHNTPVQDGVRTDRYKLMYFPRTREWQLFDLELDPQEMRSRHADTAYAETLAQMKQLYYQTREGYGVNSAVIPATRGDEEWWRERDLAKQALAKRGPYKLAFLGDSITQGWEETGEPVWREFYADRDAINLGFRGDRTEHLIWRLEHGHFGAAEPGVAVVLIGTNNTGHLMQDPTEVAAGVEKVLGLIAEKSPGTRVVLHGVFPRGKTADDPGRLNNLAINAQIGKLADGERVEYLDVGHAFLEPDGTITEAIMPDALHLSAEGYRRWAEALEPKLVELGL